LTVPLRRAAEPEEEKRPGDEYAAQPDETALHEPGLRTAFPSPAYTRAQPAERAGVVAWAPAHRSDSRPQFENKATVPFFSGRSYFNLNAAQQVVYCEGTLLVAYS
jgi:hypothetical protein